MKKTAGDLLREKAKLFEEKGKQYGHSYKTFGEVMAILFPEGLEIRSVEEWNRLGVFQMIIHKVIRSSNKLFDDQKALDSFQDLQVYGAMMEELLLDGKE